MFLNYETELGLSEEQVNTIKSLNRDMKKKQIREKADMQVAMIDMEVKLKEETVDVEGISAMIDQGMGAMAQSAKQTVEAYAKLKAVLTPEQWVKLKELKSGKSSKHAHE